MNWDLIKFGFFGTAVILLILSPIIMWLVLQLYQERAKMKREKAALARQQAKTFRQPPFTRNYTPRQVDGALELDGFGHPIRDRRGVIKPLYAAEDDDGDDE